MRAIVYDRYGPPEVLHVADVAMPEPREDEVRVSIRATSATTGDWRARSLKLPTGFGPMGRLVFGVTGPRQRILGTEFAGEVDAVGAGVKRFKVGDQVFGFPGGKMGCYAEYRCISENGPIVNKPENLSYAEAATISFGGMTMLDFYRRGKLRAGERVLVNGASGGVGIAAVQLAHHFGARVTAVCSGGNAGMVRKYGADDVIDYTRQDFAEGSARYDVIVDTAGTAPYSRSRRVLTPTGRLLQVLGGLGDLLLAPLAATFSGQRVIAGPASERVEDLATLAELAAAGRFRAAIDRTYTLEQAAEAHRYVELGRKKGSVALTLGARPDTRHSTAR